MDTNKLIQEARARFKHQEAKTYLQEKYLSRLIMTSQGGMWNVTTEFLAFLRTSKNEQDVLIDSFNKPIKVNTKQLLLDTEALYSSVMSEWYNEFTELQSKR